MKGSALVQKDAVAGLLFIAIGLVFGLVGLDYGIGQLRRFQPGFFPVVVASALVIVGVFTALKGLRTQDDAITGWSPRALVVLGAVVLFALLIQPLGLLLTVAVTSLIASIAGHHRFDLQAVALAAALGVASWLVFVLLLNVPVRLFPAMFGI